MCCIFRVGENYKLIFCSFSDDEWFSFWLNLSKVCWKMLSKYWTSNRHDVQYVKHVQEYRFYYILQLFSPKKEKRRKEYLTPPCKGGWELYHSSRFHIPNDLSRSRVWEHELKKVAALTISTRFETLDRVSERKCRIMKALRWLGRELYTVLQVLDDDYSIGRIFFFAIQCS